MAGDWIVVRNWAKFQHRDANRNAELGVPIWTKVYTRLLFDDQYIDLSLTEKGALHLVWLQFSASDGQLSVNRVTSRGPLSVSRSLLESLSHAGFVGFSASKPPRLSASLEKSREEKNRVEEAAVSTYVSEETADNNSSPETTTTFQELMHRAQVKSLPAEIGDQE